MQETNISINEIIMYLRKSRSDDPYMTPVHKYSGPYPTENL